MSTEELRALIVSGLDRLMNSWAWHLASTQQQSLVKAQRMFWLADDGTQLAKLSTYLGGMTVKNCPAPTPEQIAAVKLLFGDDCHKACADPTSAINFALLIALFKAFGPVLPALWALLAPFLIPAPTPPVPNVP